MSTLAQITAAINDDIRNKTPLVLKTEHADVEQLITNEMFPSSVRLTFNGTTQTNGTPNITVPSSLATDWKIEFDIYFEKIGNRVFYSGFISNKETSKVLGLSFGGILLAEFPTTLLKTLIGRTSISQMITSLSTPSILPNAFISFTNSGMVLFGGIPFGAVNCYIEGSYKVAN
jgi:hypothetical protein